MKIFSLVLLLLLSPLTLAKPVDFQLPTLEGAPLKLSDYRGQWVVVNFWASWCTPCVKELPELAAYQKANIGRVQLIGVNYEENSAAESLAFLAQLPPTGFPHVKDDGSSDGIGVDFFTSREGEQFSMLGLPATFFIDPQGEMRAMHLGPLDRESLGAKIEALQKQP